MISTKRTVFITTVWLFLIFSLPVVGLAEDTGNLEGIVYESDGKTPLKDARIILELFERGKKTGNEFKSNITDSSGEYKLENVPVGKYKGKIMLKGKHYRIKRVDFFIHVIKGETNYVSFALKGGRK